MLSLLALAPAFTAVTTEFAQPALPATWRHVAPADLDAVVPVLVSLRPRNLAELHRIASAVSDPRHPKYGEFLSLAEVNELTAPSASDLAAVAAWLAPAAVGAIETLPSGAVRARLHAGRAAALLRTSFTEIEEAASGRRLVRAGAYTLPAPIAAAVEAIFGLHGLPLPPTEKYVRSSAGRRLQPGPPPSPVPKVVPSVIVDQYQMGSAKASGNVKCRQAVAEFQGQTMNTTDVEKFFAEYVAAAPASAAEVYAIHGEPQQGDGVEAMLDIEYMMGVRRAHTLGAQFCAIRRNSL